ncbi:MAG: sulfotransferase [Cytophagales bacterium]|nr:sulfotransferase [Cytophagales bacterium]
MTKEKRPDFLGIGAQKSATRWLYNQLKRHPDVYLTPIKELHYFDRIMKANQYKDRYDLDVWKNNFHKMSFARFLNLRWQYKFFYGEYSDDWYTSLFNRAGKRKAGEITPEYSILRKEDIEVVRGINPEMRIVYLLRDPVSRAWSHFRMQVRRGGLRYKDMHEDDVFKLIGSANYFIKGNYLDNLKRWYSVFDRQQIFIGYLEEVKENPDDLLKNILTHLGVSVDSRHFQKSMEEPSHVGQEIPIEPKYEEFLREKYYQHNEDLYELLGNPIIKGWNK